MGNDRMWQRAKLRIVFRRNADMDFYFQLALASMGYGGVSFGEAFHVASGIRESDPRSWAPAWFAAAGRLERAARTALAADHARSARELLFRAYTYVRIGRIGLSVRDSAFRSSYLHAVALFRESLALSDYRCDRVAIPVAAKTLPGYFMAPAASASGSRPTILCLNGGETLCEDLFTWIGRAALDRGYNVVSFDGPSDAAYRFHDPDARVRDFGEVRAAIGGVIDWTLARPDVDEAKFALVGFSGGGFKVVMTAAADDRVRAAVASAPICDLAALAQAEFPKFLLGLPGPAWRVLAAAGSRLAPFTMRPIEQVLWSVDLPDVPALMDLLRTGVADPEPIACPFLGLAGASESPAQLAQARLVVERVGSERKKLRIFAAEDGADAHTQINNLSLMNAEVLDWLDDTFGAGG